MQILRTPSCRASTGGPQASPCCVPVRVHACGGLRHAHCMPSSACSSRQQQTGFCCPSHQRAVLQPCSRSVLAAAAQQQPAASTSSSTPAASQLQQQAQQAVTVPTAAAAAAAPPQRALPFAALSRVLLTSSNANVFKTLTQRRQPVSGPMGVLLFLATLIAASFAAIRSVLLKRGKSCKTCRGFGLQRCRLCLGSGRVDWAAKLKHFDVCPLCMNRRFIVCAECGGHYHRAMFAHRRRQAGGAFEPDSGSDGTSSGGFGREGGPSYQGPIVLNLAAAGAGAGGVTVVTPARGGLDVNSGSINPVLSSMSD